MFANLDQNLVNWCILFKSSYFLVYLISNDLQLMSEIDVTFQQLMISLTGWSGDMLGCLISMATL